MDALVWLLAPLSLPSWLVVVGRLGHTLHPGVVALGAALFSVALASHLALPVRARGLLGAVEALVLMPITLLSQSLAPLYALVAAPLEARGFTVIDKNLVSEKGPEGRLEGPLGDPQVAPLAQASSVGAPDRSPYRGFVS